MKYIKTYESFYSEDDMAREISMVLDPATVDRFQFDPVYKDTSMFRAYEVDHDVDPQALVNLRGYMNDEHNLHFTYIEGTDKLIILTEKPLKDACIDWLNANYSEMEEVESKDFEGCILYRYEPKDNVLFYDKEDEVVYVEYKKIWSFFEDYFDLEYQDVKAITEEWMGETYNLRGVTVDRRFWSNTFYAE
jgi:hypothetical protein